MNKSFSRYPWTTQTRPTNLQPRRRARKALRRPPNGTKPNQVQRRKGEDGEKVCGEKRRSSGGGRVLHSAFLLHTIGESDGRTSSHIQQITTTTTNTPSTSTAASMSMKFFSGLQDLLGLYQGDTAPQGTSGSPSLLSSPSAPLPPSAASTHYPNHNVPGPQRRRSINELNAQFKADTEENESRSAKCSHNRSVHFPPEEKIVSGWHAAPTSPFHPPHHHFHQFHHQILDLHHQEPQSSQQSNFKTSNLEEIAASYARTCAHFGTTPNTPILKQITCFHRVPGLRQELLSLKGERVTHQQMEALEEILRRLQFESLDFEYTFLDDDCVISLSEMLEFYDSTQKLNLSFNKQINLRGWTAIFKAVRNSPSLQLLNLRYTSLSDKALPSLCRTLRATPPPSLTCLHLEHVGLAGKNLLLVVCALKTNTTLKELYLGENNLQQTDGAHLYQLIVSNTGLTTLDLRNNELHDAGVRHICDALRNGETCKRSALQALVLWNNRITGACMDSMARALCVNRRLETLNVGSNNLGELGIQNLKPALLSPDCGLQRMGLQSTSMNNQCAIMIAECMADNTTMIRIDLRDNTGISSAGLLALHSAMRHNKTLTILNLDQRLATTTSAKVRSYQDDFRRIFDEIRDFCEKNKRMAVERIEARACDERDDDENGGGVAGDDDFVHIDGGMDEVINEQQTKQDEQQTKSEGSPENQTEVSLVDGEQEEDDDLGPEDICRSGSVDSSLFAKPKGINRLARSASLTCAEYYPDSMIQERLREMLGSTHSLDETGKTKQKAQHEATTGQELTTTTEGEDSHSDSIRTIKKGQQAPFVTAALQHQQQQKAEWGSLPSLPGSSSPTITQSGGSVVKKLRRFSVSPTTSTFDLAPTLKPTTSTPSTGTSLVEGKSSSLSSLPTSGSTMTFNNNNNKIGVITPVHERTSVDCDEEREALNEAFLKKLTQGFLSDNTEKDLPSTPIRRQEDIENEVKAVVQDLVNYVVYEENSVVERKKSLLLQGGTMERPDPEKLMRLAFGEKMEIKETTMTPTPTTPNRAFSIVEDVCEESEDRVVESIVRGLVRDVLKQEKEQLRGTLERKRNRLLASSPSTPNPPKKD
ncbi:unnamed protein product, partial [Mesorhabditis belari]|uniref:Uncharacterized protein n=1 Tax=Mesorhabditis belari TaxID=2138241 RepID=A0AAF3FQU6_9BILA